MGWAVYCTQDRLKALTGHKHPRVQAVHLECAGGSRTCRSKPLGQPLCRLHRLPPALPRPPQPQLQRLYRLRHTPGVHLGRRRFAARRLCAHIRRLHGRRRRARLALCRFQSTRARLRHGSPRARRFRLGRDPGAALPRLALARARGDKLPQQPPARLGYRALQQLHARGRAQRPRAADRGEARGRDGRERVHRARRHRKLPHTFTSPAAIAPAAALVPFQWRRRDRQGRPDARCQLQRVAV